MKEKKERKKERHAEWFANNIQQQRYASIHNVSRIEIEIETNFNFAIIRIY